MVFIIFLIPNIYLYIPNTEGGVYVKKLYQSHGDCSTKESTVVPLYYSKATSTVLIFNRQKVICGSINSIRDMVILTWSQLSHTDTLYHSDGFLKAEMDVL